jgi:CHASE3 domain sensor protein
MNGIRAYFHRIRGRLWLALTLGVFGMLAIYLVSTYSLSRFTTEIVDELGLLQDRMQLTLQLQDTIIDQINATQLYLVAGDGSALEDAAALGRTAQELQTRLSAQAPSEVLQQLTALRAVHTETVRAIDDALEAHRAGAPCGGCRAGARSRSPACGSCAHAPAPSDWPSCAAWTSRRRPLR